MKDVSLISNKKPFNSECIKGEYFKWLALKQMRHFQHYIETLRQIRKKKTKFNFHPLS